MRKECVLLALILIRSFPLVQTAEAHSGRTDSSGCHVQRSTGIRHCHNSNPAPRPDISPRYSPSPSTDALSSCNNQYNRGSWGYTGVSFFTNVGYYSGQICIDIDADHVVSLRDAHDSGGCSWSASQKATFANDSGNLVPSCASINRAKGASLPVDFIRIAGDGSGVDFNFSSQTICKYLSKYKAIKDKYRLSYSQNSAIIFSMCGLGF